MSPYDGKGIYAVFFPFSGADATFLSVWRLHVTRKRLHPIWMQYFSPTSINSHFCYVCGELIVKSALRADIQAAVSKHYRACRLFDDVRTRERRR